MRIGVQQRQRGLCQVPVERRRRNLVRRHPHPFACPQLTLQCADEVLPRRIRPVDPACSQHQGLGMHPQHGPFALQLALAIHAKRMRFIALNVGPRPLDGPIEDVIRREEHKGYPVLLRIGRQHGRPMRIGPVGLLRLVLAAVYPRHRAGADHQVRDDFPKGLGSLFGVAQSRQIKSQPALTRHTRTTSHLLGALRRKRVTQLHANLPGRAHDQRPLPNLCAQRFPLRPFFHFMIPILVPRTGSKSVLK